MKILKFSLFVFSFFFLAPFSFSQIEDEKIEISMATVEGAKISEEEIIKLEEKLKETPENLVLRAKVLGYYFSRSIKDRQLRKKFQENVLWVIKNKPESQLAGMPQCELNPHIDGEIYEEGKKLWLENIEKFKENKKVLENAGNYFMVYDKEIAEGLFKKLQEIAPENPIYYEKLGHLYSLKMIGKKGKEREEISKKALLQYEIAYSFANEIQKFHILEEMAKLSFEANEIEKAKKYSMELLDKKEGKEGKWFYGNAIHYGNIVLGKIALKENKKEEAKKYLIEAGKTPGSPQLNSFGPDFTLAEELLEAG
ncbi:MAG: hypothetical protein WHV67_08675, partial [Thermoanaerobaculia bacterium]